MHKLDGCIYQGLDNVACDKQHDVVLEVVINQS